MTSAVKGVRIIIYILRSGFYVMKEPINLVNDLKWAYDYCKKHEVNTFTEAFKNLISHAFAEMEAEIKAVLTDKNQEYTGFLFFLVQDILIFTMFSDCDLIKQEYDAYVKFCDWAGYRPLTPDELSKRLDEIEVDKIAEDIKFLLSMRELIDGSKFDSFVKGLCCFCFMGDRKLDENEYYILRSFYERDYDYKPETWEDCKAELKAK